MSERRRHGTVAMLLVACVTLIAACGSSGKSTASNTTTVTTVAGNSTSTGGGSTQTTTNATTTGSTGGVSVTCPSQAAISAAAGKSYPAPMVSSGGGFTACNYHDSTGSVNLVIDFTKSSTTTPSVLQSVANTQAAAQHVKAVAVPGYGTAAFLYTYGTAASSANGIAASSLDMLAGSEIIDLAGSEPVAQIEAIAHYVLNH
jgi:hypothetical protein